MTTTPESLKLEGNSAYSSGDWAKASASYTRALQLLDGDGNDDWDMRRVLHSNRSQARLRAGDPDGALKDAEEALRLAPGWSKAYARKAGALEQMGKLPEARRALEAALAGDPTNTGLLDSMKRVEALIANPALAAASSSSSSSSAATTTVNSASTTNSASAAAPELATIDDLFAEVAQIESAANCVSKFSKTTNVDHDAETKDWTRENQVERIFQKHYKFLNLNPYHVFGFESLEANAEDIKKRFHKLSSLVHPDKNPDPRAREAFEIVTGAHGELSNVDRRNLYLEIFAVARQNVEASRAKMLASPEYRGNEEKLIKDKGTLKDAVDREIKLVLARNEEDRVRAMRLKQASEERAAKQQKEKEPDWGAIKRTEDEFKEGQADRVKGWYEFQKSKKGKLG